MHFQARFFFYTNIVYEIFTKNSLQTLSALDCKVTMKKDKKFSLKLPFNIKQAYSYLYFFSRLSIAETICEKVGKENLKGWVDLNNQL